MTMAQGIGYALLPVALFGAGMASSYQLLIRIDPKAVPYHQWRLTVAMSPLIAILAVLLTLLLWIARAGGH